MSASLVETICIDSGKPRHLDYHNRRMNTTRAQLYERHDPIFLENYIDSAQVPSQLTKCRVMYNEEIIEVQYLPYTIHFIHSLRAIHVRETCRYDHKWTDREHLRAYYNQREDSDDILMIRSGLLTDTYYANVALSKDDLWYTPALPLLEGTARARLLDEKRLIPQDIALTDLDNYRAIRLFNAMIPFGEIELPIASISIG